MSQRSYLDSHRSTPNLPGSSDIVIVGAGLSGIATAYEILELHANTHPNTSPPSITILEARSLCLGATARNGGHLKLGVPRYHAMLKQYGPEVANELADFHLAHIYAIKAIVDKENIDCDFLLTRTFDVFMDEDQAKEQEDMVRDLYKANIEAVKREIQVIQKNDIEAVTGVKNAKGARAGLAAQLWAYKLCTGLAERIIDKINLQTHTTVHSVTEKKNNQHLLEVITDRGTVKARKVVFANNGYVAGTLPELHDIIIPWKGTCSYLSKSVKPPSDQQVRTYTYNVCKDPKHVDYTNHRLDGNTIIGGGYEVYGNNPESYISVVDDSTMIKEPEMRHYFEERLRTYWRDWSTSGAEVKEIWTGIMGYTPDEYPLIGEIPGRKGQYILAGYSGAGMPNICLSAKGIAKMVINDAPFEEIGLPRIYKISEERLTTLRQVAQAASQ